MLRRCLTAAIGFSLIFGATALAQTEDAAHARRRTAIVDVFQKCRDAVVNISTTRVVRVRSLRGASIFDEIFETPQAMDRRVQSVGSGAVVHESGYIVTNAHVVAQASDVRVTFADGSTLPADIVAVDPDRDLAVVKVRSQKTLTAIHLGKPGDIMIGETVIAIGDPLGLQHTVTTGIVSALNRDLQFNNDVAYTGLIQTDTAINPGNSGGPLLNVNGELMGINTAIRGDAQNIGFAIPVDRVWEMLPQLLDVERRERVRFGVQVSGPDARVAEVRAGSPAATAGLHRGDKIISFNGEPLRNGIDFYVRLLSQKPDSQVHLAVERDGKTRNLAVPLQSVPMPDGGKLAQSLFGMTLLDVTPAQRARYDLPDYAGVMVEGVDDGSPAARAGIQPGDFVLRLERVAVSSVKDVGLALEQTNPAERVIVEGLRLRADPPFFWTVSIRTRGEKP